MLADAARSALFSLVGSACCDLATRVDADQFRHGIAYYDSERDKEITKLPEFAGATATLQAEPAIIGAYGSDNVHRLAVQFVYNTIRLLDSSGNCTAAFGVAWSALAAETADPNWRFAAVANLNNFSYDGDIADLGNGVSVQGRSFERLKETLHFDQVDFDRLSEDWSAGGGASSHILVVTTSQPKSPTNFILSSDGAAYGLAARALLAMRLIGPGDLHIGRMSLHRPGRFNVGVGGRSYSGWTIWRPGTAYRLSDEMLPAIREQADTLAAVEKDLQSSARHIGLAVRSFSSIYDRLLHQAEDCVIDSITALEALWKLDTELSFRLAFRTASLLGLADHGREQIFRTLRTYYKIRSKIVHGGGLSDKEREQMLKDEPLREIVRQMLRGFIYLLAHPGEWTVGRVMSDPDLLLLHTENRLSVQKAMRYVQPER